VTAKLRLGPFQVTHARAKLEAEEVKLAPGETRVVEARVILPGEVAANKPLGEFEQPAEQLRPANAGATLSASPKLVEKAFIYQLSSVKQRWRGRWVASVAPGCDPEGITLSITKGITPVALRGITVTRRNLYQSRPLRRMTLFRLEGRVSLI
jgi:hypothetical protein